MRPTERRRSRKLCSHLPLVGRGADGLVALLESARSPPGPGERFHADAAWPPGVDFPRPPLRGAWRSLGLVNLVRSRSVPGPCAWFFRTPWRAAGSRAAGVDFPRPPHRGDGSCQALAPRCDTVSIEDSWSSVVSKSDGASLTESADEAADDEALGEPSLSGLAGETPEAGMDEELADAPSRGAESDEAASAQDTHDMSVEETLSCKREPSPRSRSVAPKTRLTCLPHSLWTTLLFSPGGGRLWPHNSRREHARLGRGQHTLSEEEQSRSPSPGISPQ